jgi:hypothetical protein
MAHFKDSKGRQWTLALTIGRARECKERTGVDLLCPESGKPSLPEVLGDEYRVADILEVLLADEFRRLGLDPASMLREEWDGATSRAAYDALLEELTSFFEGRGQTARAEIVRKTHQAIQAAFAVVADRVAALDPVAEVKRLIAEEDGRTAGDTSGRPLAG